MTGKCQWNLENFTAAASKYTDDGTLYTSDYGSYKGFDAIKGFFETLGGLTTQFDYEYERCESDCSFISDSDLIPTFVGHYNFGDFGIFDMKIKLANGKIRFEEVISRVEEEDRI